MATSPPPKRTRTSRDDGRRNMVRAAMELLEDRSPDEITVRDIAERAGHHHRYVQDWFGGKVGLFLEVLTLTSAQLAEYVELRTPSDQLNPDLARGARLLAWLATNDPDRLSGDRMRPVVSRMEHFFHDRFGVPRDEARLLARHTALLMTAYVVFGHAYGAPDDDHKRLFELQIRLGQMLGTRPGV